MRRPVRVLVLLAALAALAGGGWAVSSGGAGEKPVRTAERRPAPAVEEEAPLEDAPPPKVAVALDPSEAAAARDERAEARELARSASSRRPESPADIRRQIAELRKALKSGTRVGARAKVLANGEAVAPSSAPPAVQDVIAAANAIARTPYKWGGGHGAWRDSGYDCSGSVSFALAGAGLLDGPLNSSGFLTYGASGPGRWITIYTNPGHMFMVVAGLRFDTSGAGRKGTRWQEGTRGTSGFTVRHPPGL